MKEFTIKDIENLSGIKAHTWRIWEQRYSVGVSQRKDSNHRFYSHDNLKQILQIAYLYHSGVKISKIFALDPEEIKKLTLAEMPAENGHEFYIKELLEASIDLDEERFEITFQEAMKRMGIEETFLKILTSFQEKIGLLWLTDHVIPAQEHFTSNIIRQKLAVAIDRLPMVKETAKKVIVLYTPEHEQHEIALQFAHYILKKNLNKVIYFGSNVSLSSLVIYSKTHRFTHVFFHLATNLTNKKPDEYLQELTTHFPAASVVMSGLQTASVVNTPNNVRLLQTREAAAAFLAE